MIPIGILTASATSSFSFLLDQYPNAAGAYSLRKLRSAYTGNCIQVRRSSDNATQNIGFVNNILDTTALTTFCGAGNGFVSIWYDQSGNSKDATNSTLANQPQIVSSGSVILVNGKAALQVDTTDNLTITGTIPLSPSGIKTTFCTFKRTANNINFIMYGGGEGHYIISNIFYLEGNGKYTASSTDNTANQNLLTGIYDIATFNQYKNNVLLSSSVTNQVFTQQISTIFSTGSFFSSGWGQEFIFYSTNQSANITAINTNINSYYSIY